MADSSQWAWWPSWAPSVSVGSPNFRNISPDFFNDMSRLYNSMPSIAGMSGPPAMGFGNAGGTPMTPPMQPPGAQPPQPPGTVQTQDNNGSPITPLSSGPGGIGSDARFPMANQPAPIGNYNDLVNGPMWPTPPAPPAAAPASNPYPPQRPKGALAKPAAASAASSPIGRRAPRFIPIQYQAGTGGASSGSLAPTPGSRAPIYTALNLFGRG